MEEERARRWEDMPADCLVAIFQRLALDDLTVGVPFVCKSWARAAREPGCWKVVDFRSLDLMPWSEFPRRFVARHSSLHDFSFSALLRFVLGRARGSSSSVAELVFPLASAVSIDDLDYAAAKCPGLRRLALPDHLMLEDERRVPELVGRWKDLEELEMESKPSSFSEIVAGIGRGCRRFARLRVTGLITGEDARAVAEWLPELKCLELSKSYLTKEELEVILRGCRKLERVVVRNCLGFAADEEVLKMGAGVKSFEHEGSKLLDDYGYETDEPDKVQTGVFALVI
ncbi:F-box/LRR-repeat protein [Canna indica]|uniref:F-box/LRR-repeat protein n=1 Tax=Canna indica TaxID=4628 RepID=A0AAQ3KJW2_9LILI|nr:F-box/LRR-repeat protein [Canna indica]